MKIFASTLICACMALSSAGTSAQDATKKNDAMPKDGMKKDAPKIDDAMMKQEAMCTDMMKKDAMPSEAVKK